MEASVRGKVRLSVHDGHSEFTDQVSITERAMSDGFVLRCDEIGDMGRSQI